MRNHLLANRHTKMTALIAVGLIGSLFVPWSTTVSAPVLLQAREFSRIYARHAGELADLSVSNGDYVTPNTLLFRIEDDEIAAERKIAWAEADLRRQKLRGVGSNRDALLNRQTILKELELYEERVRGLRERESLLELRSPIKGTVESVDSLLHQGVYIGEGQMLALIVGETGLRARGYLAADDVQRVAPGASARFIPDDISMPSIEMTVSEVSTAAIDTVDLPSLASTQNGNVAVNTDARGALRPASPVYRISADANSPGPSLAKVQRGILSISGKPESIASRMFRQIASVLVRESGF